MSGLLNDPDYDTNIKQINSNKNEIVPYIREFKTGANRDSDIGKVDIEGHLSPEVLMAYCEYMNKHRYLKDGSIRDSDNWQKGMPISVYVKSLMRHVFDVWLWNRGKKNKEPIKDALCGVIFNTSGIFLEILKEENKEGK